MFNSLEWEVPTYGAKTREMKAPVSSEPEVCGCCKKNGRLLMSTLVEKAPEYL